MDWFIRFTLGLHARIEDAAALRKALPELERGEFQLVHPRYIWPFHPDFETNKNLLAALRNWVAKVEQRDDFLPADHRSCPSNNCPLRSNHARVNEDEDSFITQLMVVAGGRKANKPKENFLNLVRQSRSKITSPPKNVILTDPYIYSDISEDGHEGGYSNLVAYLEALEIPAEDSFTLRMTPSPKKANATQKKNLQGHIQSKYKNIQFNDFSPNLKFHDRFYVVHHKLGEISGVFGPSINGLTSDAIVLMGDITGMQPLKKFKDWFA